MIPFIPASIEGCYYSKTKCLCESFDFIRFNNGVMIEYGTKHDRADLMARYEAINKFKYDIFVKDKDKEKYLGKAYSFLLFSILTIDTSFEFIWRTWINDEMKDVIIKDLIYDLEFSNGYIYLVKYNGEMVEVNRKRMKKYN